jgi:hypothetical protein
MPSSMIVSWATATSVMRIPPPCGRSSRQVARAAATDPIPIDPLWSTVPDDQPSNSASGSNPEALAAHTGANRAKSPIAASSTRSGAQRTWLLFRHDAAILLVLSDIVGNFSLEVQNAENVPLNINRSGALFAVAGQIEIDCKYAPCAWQATCFGAKRQLSRTDVDFSRSH